VGRFDQRQAFLVSATVHLMLLTILSSKEFRPASKPEPPRDDLSRARRVLLPPPDVLRQVVPPRSVQPRPPAAAPAPVPTPPPPEAKAKDRISIGPPSNERAKQLILRREDDLTKVPKGTPNAAPSAAPTPPPASATAEARPPGSKDPDTPGATGLKLPPGVGTLDRGDDATRRRPGEQGPEPSITSSLRNLEKHYQDGPSGIVSGTGQSTSGFQFDPQGADFTVWVNHLKNEVYRNWIVPQPALMGFHGHVDIEFVVERDGTISSIKVLKSAGNAALDRAAVNALQGSRLLPLPADYAPVRLPIYVSFYYNEGPSGS
jgi:protein TonB